MSNATLRLAMGQMLVKGGEAEANLRRTTSMMANAANQGCIAIVLPECLDLGLANTAALELAQSIPGEFSEILCQAAQKSQIYVTAGLTERVGGRVCDAALLVSPDGQILLKHRKTNILTDVEESTQLAIPSQSSLHPWARSA